MAATAVSRLPKAVMTTTGTSGRLATMRSHSSSPFMPRMLRSVTTTSTSASRSAASAAAGSVRHSVTSKPCGGEARLEQLAHAPVVVDDEDAAAHASASRSGSVGRPPEEAR